MKNETTMKLVQIMDTYSNVSVKDKNYVHYRDAMHELIERIGNNCGCMDGK